jgi:thiol-disulfide isomerase/thioredoxin
MILKTINIFVLVTGLILTTACSDQENTNSETVANDVVNHIEVIDEAGIDKLIQERNGKILLLNFWATWCIPCRDEFPDLVKIAKTYREGNVEVIGISADYPDEIESKIQPFLKSQNATFRNYVKNGEDDEALINSINPEWSGALPATFVYGTDGALRKSHFGQNDFDGFREMIELIQESKTN